MSKINKQQQPAPTPPPTSPSGTGATGTRASQDQLNAAREAAAKVREKIYDGIKTLGDAPETLLDMDGDGRVTAQDAKFIEAYIGDGKNGKRGVDLREFVSPYANSSLASISSMETKAQNLINNKTFDFNGDGTVNKTDANFAKSDISRFAKEDGDKKLQSLVNSGAADLNGDAVTDAKDLTRIKSFFIDGISATTIETALMKELNITREQAGQLVSKLEALKTNSSFDSNADGRITLEDTNRLFTTVTGGVPKADGRADEGQRSKNIQTLIDNKTLDVNRDGKVTKQDIDLIEAYQKGVSVDSLKRMAGALDGKPIQDDIKALLNSGKLNINKNNKNAGNLDMKRISEAVERHETKEAREAKKAKKALGEGPTGIPTP